LRRAVEEPRAPTNIAARLRNLATLMLLAATVVALFPPFVCAQSPTPTPVDDDPPPLPNLDLCVNQTDDGIPGEGTLTVDCPADEPPAVASPVAADGQLPSAADGDLLTGTFYFLNKPSTFVSDGVLTPCAAVVTVAPGSLTYHGTRNPSTGETVDGGNDAYVSLPASAVTINGVACTAPANVTVNVYYDTPGEPGVGIEGHMEDDSLTCGVWDAVRLTWFVVPDRRIAWLDFTKFVPVPIGDMCAPDRYECAMTRPLCRGGVLDLTSGQQAADE